MTDNKKNPKEKYKKKYGTGSEAVVTIIDDVINQVGTVKSLKRIALDMNGVTFEQIEKKYKTNYFSNNGELLYYFLEQVVEGENVTAASVPGKINKLNEKSPFAMMHVIAKKYSEDLDSKQKTEELLTVAENLDTFGEAYNAVKNGGEQNIFEAEEFKTLSAIYEYTIENGSRFLLLNNDKNFSVLQEFSDIIAVARLNEGNQFDKNNQKTEEMQQQLAELGKSLGVGGAGKLEKAFTLSKAQATLKNTNQGKF